MLFNAIEFLFLFLPVVFFGYHGLRRFFPGRPPLFWLVFSSLFFYGWWNPRYLLLILGSILFNYALGLRLAAPERRRNAGSAFPWPLAFGIAVNLFLLGFFKYAGFLVDNLNALTEAGWRLDPILLPLAISFFTFQQIAYLVDAWRGETASTDFLGYALFITFFPQLIAGPIVQHREMAPQFAQRTFGPPRWDFLAMGWTLFVLGLFKKVALADQAALYAKPVFLAAERGETLYLFEAWGGAMAYTFQIYFDFSGYSDMAVGLGLLFGIHLPLNFFSPYQAASIIDFWRRWHMTLSRFLRNYLYVPLGGNRRGPWRRYRNLLLTMALGGLWHGAGWTFLVWGVLHGCFLIINQAWRTLKRAWGWREGGSRWRYWGARLVTLAAVASAWVFFRADSAPGAWNLLRGMWGFNGLLLPPSLAGLLPDLSGWLWFSDDFWTGYRLFDIEGLALIAGLWVIAWFFPNTAQFLGGLAPERRAIFPEEPREPAPFGPLWTPRPLMAGLAAVLFVIVLLNLGAPSEFLYFQF